MKLLPFCGTSAKLWVNFDKIIEEIPLGRLFDQHVILFGPVHHLTGEELAKSLADIKIGIKLLGKWRIYQSSQHSYWDIDRFMERYEGHIPWEELGENNSKSISSARHLDKWIPLVPKWPSVERMQLAKDLQFVKLR